MRDTKNIPRWKGPNPTRLGEIITTITQALHPYRIRCIYKNTKCHPTNRADYVITMKKQVLVRSKKDMCYYINC